MRGSPMEPELLPSETNAELRRRFEAAKKLEYLFPIDLAAQFYYQENKKLFDENRLGFFGFLTTSAVMLPTVFISNFKGSGITLAWILILAVAASPILLPLFFLSCLFIHFTGDEKKNDMALCKAEVSNQTFSYVSDWLFDLQKHSKESGYAKSARLSIFLFPPAIELQAVRSRLEGAISNLENQELVISRFADNVSEAVDKSFGGLEILPATSELSALTIKKDGSGYYLA